MPQSAPHALLIVEDDEVTREKMRGYFETEGYHVYLSEGASQALPILDDHRVDLVLLDINLTDGDGLSLAREIRRRSEVGIIFVSGRNDEVDRIVGLEIGADDYVTKPFNLRELLARVRGLIRRTAINQPSQANDRVFGAWRFDPLRRTLTDNQGRLTELTRAELETLDLFTRHPGTTLTRDRLMSAISHRSWSPGDRTIDVLIRRLRRKLETDPSEPRLIRTVHGEGYMFCEPVADASRSFASSTD